LAGKSQDLPTSSERICQPVQEPYLFNQPKDPRDRTYLAVRDSMGVTSSNVLGIVLGGGKGKRLFPLTKHRSKPAVPLAGKYCIVDIALSNCINSDIRKVFVLTQFNSASLNQHIAHTYRFDHFSQGFVNILAAEQTLENPNWFQGSADSVRQSIQHLEEIDVSHVLILSGDQLYQMDYRRILEFHLESKADITVATIPVPAGQATGFGIMKVNEEGQIVLFQEKPALEQLEPLESKLTADLVPINSSKVKAT